MFVQENVNTQVGGVRGAEAGSWRGLQGSAMKELEGQVQS